MKIAIDVVPIRYTGEMGGAFQFVIELIKGFAQKNDSNQYILLTAEWNHVYFEQFEKYGFQRICVQKSIQAQNQTGQKIFFLKAIKKIINKIERKFNIKIKNKIPVHQNSILRKNHVDLLFCPMSAITYAEPGIPVINVIYDIQHEFYPQFFKSDELIHRKKFYQDIYDRVDYTICISEYTQKTLIEKLNFQNEKTEVIYISIQNRLNEINSKTVATLGERGLDGKRFAYYPANLWQHKNHDVLLTAMSMYFAQFSDSDLHLFLSGSFLEEEKAFKEKIALMHLSDKVFHLGYVTEQEVSFLMNNAEFLIFPSLFEGFGIPVAEAMAMGTAVLCSRNTSLPEVAGDAALYFDPRKPDEIVNAIAQVETDVVLKQQLIASGLKQVKKFNKDAMILNYSAALEKVSKMGGDAYFIEGIYEDNWSGENVFVSLSKTPIQRIVSIELTLPSISPFPYCKASILNNGKRRRMVLSKGQVTVINETLNSGTNNFQIGFHDCFTPRDIGLSDDRQLGVQFSKIEIKSLHGELLFTKKYSS